MNEHELPNDIRQLDVLYKSPEELIKELEKIVIDQQSKISKLEAEIMEYKKQLFGGVIPNNY